MAPEPTIAAAPAAPAVTAATAAPLCLVTVHAHPDDEASKGAPTVARYVAEGVRSVLVCCTGGEEGDLHNPRLREPGQPFHGLAPEDEKAIVAGMRAGELARSAAEIGFHEVVMLGYRDSGMPESAANVHPDSFHAADVDEATERLVAVLRRERPQVLITYGDDQRGYPHPDHLKVHDISVLAFERCGHPQWYPEAGEPWQVGKLYYSVWSKARLQAVHEALLRLRGSSPYDEAWLSRPDHDYRITTRLDVRHHLSARTRALLAHATQINPDEPWWFGLSDEEMVEVWPWEDWILARSHVGPTRFEGLEDDLFAGVRAFAGRR
jgi:mycothiol S-conjugate amidase